MKLAMQLLRCLVEPGFSSNHEHAAGAETQNHKAHPRLPDTAVAHVRTQPARKDDEEDMCGTEPSKLKE